MRYPRPVLSWLLALGLLMQWAAAVLPHARAMTMFGRLTAVELCSPAGMRTVLVDETGKPAEKTHDQTCCDLCQGPAALEAAGPQAPQRRVAYAVLPYVLGRVGLPPFPPRAPPQQPRAPPAA